MPGSQLERRPYRPPVPVEQRKRQSEALVPRGVRWARRDRHVSVPVAVPPALWTAAEIAHSAHLAGPVASASLVGTVAMWRWIAPRRWDRDAEVLYARLSCAAGCGWVSLAAWLGPASGAAPALGALLLAGSAAWAVPWWRHKRPRGQRQRARLAAEWDASWQRYASSWGLPGSRVIAVTEALATTTVRVQLVGGKQTLADVRASLPRIESALDDIGEGMVSADKVTGHRSQADIRIRHANPLASGIEWDESIAPASVSDPWYPGRTEAGQWRAMRQRDGVWANGATGTGKTTLLLTRILSLAGCDDAFGVLIDLKGGRSARPVLETCAADWVITDRAEAELLYQLAEAEILARAEGLYDGHEQATPTRRDPAIFVHVDETHRLTSVAKGTPQAAASMSTVATTGRSSAVYEDVVTQYGSLEASVRTEETRMNLGLRFAFRMPRAEQASYAIKEWQQLDVSLLELPGECYAGDAPRTSPERLRIVAVTHDEFRRLAPARVAKRGKKPPLKLWCGRQPCPAGGTWQEWADARWGRLPEAFRDISPQYREWALSHLEDEESPAAGEASGDATPAAPATRPREVSPEAAGLTARLRAEDDAIGDVPEGPLPKGAPRLADVLAAQKERLCDALAAAPAGGITAKQLQADCGMSLGTVYDKLKRLTEAGALAKAGTGLWAPVPGTDVHAALVAVEAGDEVLAARAKRATRTGKLHVA